tara:strand:+ start:9573 stop:9881 length:309 start_codon:yes stop_codon:yes gene_type:complete
MEQRMTEFELFKHGVKLMALYQVTLEQMDIMKGSPIYSQRVKQQMNRLEKSIEILIAEPMRRLDGTDEMMMNDIQNKVDMILDLSLEEIAQLKAVIKEGRDA